MVQVTIIDVLRRAGADVTVASIESGLQVQIQAQPTSVTGSASHECICSMYRTVGHSTGAPFYDVVQLYARRWSVLEE